MSIPDDGLQYIRESFISAARPLIFYDDDPDGLSSFLQFFRLNTQARGIMVKTKPNLSPVLLGKVEEYGADLVLVLDLSDVSDEFIEGCKVPIIWLDHHAPTERRGTKYFNPMIESAGKDNRPVSYWSHRICRGQLWIAMVGCIGDWFVPDFVEEFRKEYPDLLPEGLNRPDNILFDTKLGTLCKVFSFVMKGNNDKAKACIKSLAKIRSPYEILEQSTPEGKYVYKYFLKMDAEYSSILSGIKVTDEPLLMHIYSDNSTSFTSMLSNEMLHRYPDKLIIIGRKKSGEYKLSLRSQSYEVLALINKALEGVEGYGGGHRYACGANIKEHSFDRFLETLREQL